MALVLIQSGLMPLGVYDALDADQTSIKGGELVTFTTTGVVVGNSDLEAADVEDGYVGTTTKYRPAITTTMGASSKPLFLADEGTGPYYGTLFGTLVGSTAGRVTSGSALGPHTTSGSGKVTVFGQPGFYATTLDAVDTAADGLVPANATLAPNYELTYTTAGLLTPQASGQDAGGPTVARLVEFAPSGSMVNTPASLVAAINSPSGSVSSVTANHFTMAVYWFMGASA